MIVHIPWYCLFMSNTKLYLQYRLDRPIRSVAARKMSHMQPFAIFSRTFHFDPKRWYSTPQIAIQRANLSKWRRPIALWNWVSLSLTDWKCHLYSSFLVSFLSLESWHSAAFTFTMNSANRLTLSHFDHVDKGSTYAFNRRLYLFALLSMLSQRTPDRWVLLASRDFWGVNSLTHLAIHSWFWAIWSKEKRPGRLWSVE